MTAEKMAREHYEETFSGYAYDNPSYDSDPMIIKERCIEDYEAGYLAGQQSLWIPVSERLPEVEGAYLTLRLVSWCESLMPQVVGFFPMRAERVLDWVEDGVVHWQPITLPATKKGEK